MFGDIQAQELAERGPTRMNEFRRKILRRWRNVPDLAALRAAGMTVGREVKIMHNVFLDPGHPWLLSLGDHVEMSFNVTVLTHDASMMLNTGYSKLAPVSIGSRVFVGSNVVILPGVTIGDDVVIGAGAVVSRDVPPRSMVAGSPARVVKDLSEWVTKEKGRIARSPVWTPEQMGEIAARGLPPTGASASDLRSAGGQGYVGRGKQQYGSDVPFVNEPD